MLNVAGEGSRLRFEIKIGPFARLLTVKVASRAFTDFVEVDDEEAGFARSILQSP